MLPILYSIAPKLQALAITAGYLAPNAASDQVLSRLLPLTTTAGLEGRVAEEFEDFRRELGVADCVALISASGVCIWTSRECGGAQDLQRGLSEALRAEMERPRGGDAGGGDAGGGDVGEGIDMEMCDVEGSWLPL